MQYIWHNSKPREYDRNLGNCFFTFWIISPWLSFLCHYDRCIFKLYIQSTFFSIDFCTCVKKESKEYRYPNISHLAMVIWNVYISQIDLFLK